MIKKSIIAGSIAMFVAVIAISLWSHKSAIGVWFMRLF